jgi:5-methylcytosine-specific restriction endonuclease McrA
MENYEMNAHPRQDRTSLLATAKAVANSLKMQSEGTRLRIRIPSRATTTNTDGWYAVIGNLGENQPRLEIWLDRFSGYSERKLYACFHSKARQQIMSITKRVSRKLWPIRLVTSKDTQEEKYLVLSNRLRRSEFNTPILEKYSQGWTFYGIYDPTREAVVRESPHFCGRAVAFFEDVARALPHAAAEDEHREVYPQYENRRRVASHLQRERSRLLATECKIRDRYECQVCGLHFVAVYGNLGTDFAEAHHLVPLSKLRESVRTKIEDLTTVCANCHRMLHRMAGERRDVAKLRAVVRKRQ